MTKHKAGATEHFCKKVTDWDHSRLKSPFVLASSHQWMDNGVEKFASPQFISVVMILLTGSRPTGNEGSKGLHLPQQVVLTVVERMNVRFKAVKAPEGMNTLQEFPIRQRSGDKAVIGDIGCSHLNDLNLNAYAGATQATILLKATLFPMPCVSSLWSRQDTFFFSFASLKSLSFSLPVSVSPCVSLCVCLGMHAFSFSCLCMEVLVHMYECALGIRSQPLVSILPSFCSSFLPDRFSPFYLEFLRWPCWLASESQGSACLCFCSPGVTNVTTVPGFSSRVLGIKLKSSCQQSKHFTGCLPSPQSRYQQSIAPSQITINLMA